MNNNLQSEGAAFMADLIESMPQLEVLQLSGNQIGDLGAESIAESLRHAKKLNVRHSLRCFALRRTRSCGGCIVPEAVPVTGKRYTRLGCD
jgi:Ran GTPase-activating protein (RanGAP) involved in mRNA processing and transport